MVEIIGSKYCGNSPKNKLVEKVAIALEIGDLKFLAEHLAEVAIWELSDKSAAEVEDIASHINESANEIILVSIDHVVSHGKIGSANGFSQNGKGKQIHFCHVIEFSSVKFTKIRRVCSYSKS